MNRPSVSMRWRWRAGWVLFLAMLCMLPEARGQDAAALRSRHSALRDQLASNAFQKPLVLISTQNSKTLKGDVYAVIAQPYSVVGQALRDMNHWCDILILHLNVKQCLTRRSGDQPTLSLALGRKVEQPQAATYQVDFDYRVVADRPDYQAVQLHADEGPLGTQDYRIVCEATPIDAQRSFVHMSYSYGYGVAARLAMSTYLATIGHDKVGFTVIERQADGQPVYIGGVRGLLERNTMRYYLAIEAYLGAFTLPKAAQGEKRLRDWFDATERYPRQLHELSREEYLSMKRKELARQQARSVEAN